MPTTSASGGSPARIEITTEEVIVGI